MQQEMDDMVRDIEEEGARARARFQETVAAESDRLGRALTPRERWLASLPEPDGEIAQWIRANVSEDITEEDVPSALMECMRVFERCDCSPPRPARTYAGAAASEWEPGVPIPNDPRFDVPDGYRLDHVSMCPDWPNGCGWIECTYAEGSTTP